MTTEIRSETGDETGIIRDPVTGHFMPGQSANPRGRPRKGMSYLEQLQREVEDKSAELAKALVKSALKGNVKAHEYIRNTLYGMPSQRLEVSHEDSPMTFLASALLTRLDKEANKGRTVEGLDGSWKVLDTPPPASDSTTPTGPGATGA